MQAKHDFEIPHIDIVDRGSNHLCDEIYEYLNAKYTKKFQYEIKELKTYADFVSRMFWLAVDKRTLVDVVEFMALAFILDDHLDAHPHEWPFWVRIMRRNCESNGSPLCDLWAQYLNRLNDAMPKAVYDRLIEPFIEWIECYSKTPYIKSGECVVTLEEYMKFRPIEAVAPPFIALVEHTSGRVVCESVLSLDIFKRFMDAFYTHVVLVNDLYSFRKEKAVNEHRYNYIHIQAVEKSLSYQESANMTAKAIESADKELVSVRDEIIGLGIDISPIFLEEIVNIARGNISWCKVTDRYHS